MSTRVCGRCRRPLPVPPSDGSPAAPCPFCAASDGVGRAPAAVAPSAAPARTVQPRSTSSLPAPGMTQSAPPPVYRASPAPPAGAPKAAEPARRPDARDDPAAGKKRAEAFASALVETATRTTPVHSFAVPPEAIPVANQPRRRTPAPASSAQFAAGGATAPPARRATATLASLGPAVATVPAASSVRAVGGGAAAAPLPAAALAPMYAPASSIIHGGAAASAAPAMAAAPAHAYTPTPAPAAAPAAAPVLALVTAPPIGGRTPSPAARSPAESSARGADAWNIGSYLEAPVAASSLPPAAEPIATPLPEEQVSVDSEPVDVELRGAFASTLDRLPARRIGIVLGGALILAAVAVGGFKLLGRSSRLPGGVAGSSAAAVVASAGPAAAKSASPESATALPALVMPEITTKIATDPAPANPETPPAPAPAKAARPSPPEPEAAPPAPVAHESSRAAAAPKTHARTEKAKPAAKATKHAEKRASSSAPKARPHRRVSARASTPEREDSAGSESDRMARAREAYRQGNQRLFSGDAAGAITAYEEMIRLNPKDPAGYRGLGLANAQLGKRTEAVRHLRAYLKHAPNAEDRAIITSRISLLQTLP